MRLVLDASAAVNALVPGEHRDATRQHFVDADLWAPALIDTEVLSALARLERGSQITAAEADGAFAGWQRLPCQRVSTEPLLADIWKLRQAIRISDAHYVAVARALDATLLTADGRLARAALTNISILTVG